MLPTYQEQFNKITEAYIRGEIKPTECCYCFCGTLAGGDDWQLIDSFRLKHHSYSFKEYGLMEKALFSTFPGVIYCGVADILYEIPLNQSHNYENNLFAGMCAALEVLKQIHIERGEVIDQEPVFTKRQLV